MQETWVWSWAWEDPMCCGATKPLCHNYWAHVIRAHALQQEKPPQWEASTPQPERSPCSLQLQKACVQQQRPSEAKKSDSAGLRTCFLLSSPPSVSYVWSVYGSWGLAVRGGARLHSQGLPGAVSLPSLPTVTVMASTQRDDVTRLRLTLSRAPCYLYDKSPNSSR